MSFEVRIAVGWLAPLSQSHVEALRTSECEAFQNGTFKEGIELKWGIRVDP